MISFLVKFSGLCGGLEGSEMEWSGKKSGLLLSCSPLSPGLPGVSAQSLPGSLI